MKTKIFSRSFICLLAAVAGVFLFASVSPCEAGESMTVRIKDGQVQEYVNGSIRRSYGSGLVDVATDGKIVVAVTAQGHIQEYVNGSMRRSYGADVVRVRTSDGSVFADMKNGRTAEYINGSVRRIF